MRPEGIFENGDLWFGESDNEDGDSIIWYAAYTPGTDSEEFGPDYITEEVPERFPLFAMTIFPNGTKGSEVQEYFLAKKIGDARFGSECQHTRTKRGYCPDCLRKVI